MAAILKNGGHIEILRGPRYLSAGWQSMCTKFGACIVIWKILLKYAAISSPEYRVFFYAIL